MEWRSILSTKISAKKIFEFYFLVVGKTLFEINYFQRVTFIFDLNSTYLKGRYALDFVLLGN